jgi:hypothetical protein
MDLSDAVFDAGRSRYCYNATRIVGSFSAGERYPDAVDSIASDEVKDFRVLFAS